MRKIVLLLVLVFLGIGSTWALVQTGLNLPLQKDKEYTFMFRLNTEESMPVLSLILQVELKDEDGNAIFSFRIPAKVVD